MSAYNAQKTIEKAINSCLNQSYKDIEVIVVNDCSTDNTKQIVENLVNKDSRIRLINHEVNKGAGLARRTGIESIKGEYMTFLDSDDYLKEGCLEKLFNALIKYNVDIVTPGFIITDDKYKVITKRIPDRKVLKGVDKFKPNKDDTKRFMNPMLIKSSLWDNVTYSHRRFLEDTPTLVQILHYADSILTLDYAGYYYVQNPASLIHSSNLLKYSIFKTLSVKDTIIFFNSVGTYMSNKAFIEEYSKLLELDIEEEEYELYKNELDELYNYYLTITKQAIVN
jgi:glycosyltransferase involved in cell wall biosynthesis